MSFQIGSAYLMGLLLCSSVASGAEFKAEFPTTQYPTVSAAIAAAEGQLLTNTTTIKLMGDMTESTSSTLSDLTTITLKDGRSSAPKALVLQGNPTTSDIQLFSKTTGDLNLTLDHVTLAGFKSSAPGGVIYMGKAGSTLTCTVEKEVTLTPKDPATKTAGDTDIACSENASARFIKDGDGNLTINTANPNWTGSTTVKAGGGLIVGESSAYPNASWGSSTKPGDVTLEDGSTLQGLGTIYAKKLTLEKGSAWQIVGSTDGHYGKLFVENLWLESIDSLKILHPEVNPKVGDYQIATYRTLHIAKGEVTNGKTLDFTVSSDNGMLFTAFTKSLGSNGLSALMLSVYPPITERVKVLETSTTDLQGNLTYSRKMDKFLQDTYALTPAQATWQAAWLPYTASRFFASGVWTWLTK